MATPVRPGPVHFIGQLARAAAITVHAVRYYERLGLLPPAQRTEGGYRVYSAEAFERLRFIRQAQALGFRLDEIKEILRLRYAGQAPCQCVRDLLRKKLQQVGREMARLRRFQRELRRTLAHAGRLPDLPHSASAICPLIQIRRSKHAGK